MSELELNYKQKELEDEKSKSIKKVWTFEILDPNIIPIEYRTVDEKKIRQAMLNGIREIPGVKIYQESQLSLR